MLVHNALHALACNMERHWLVRQLAAVLALVFHLTQLAMDRAIAQLETSSYPILLVLPVQLEQLRLLRMSASARPDQFGYIPRDHVFNAEEVSFQTLCQQVERQWLASALHLTSGT